MSKPSKPTTSPFSLRLTNEERAHLESKAGKLSIGEYIRRCILDETTLQHRATVKVPVKEHKLLSQVLGELGQSRLANNLNQLAGAANSGALKLPPEVKISLLQACFDISEVRLILVKLLSRSKNPVKSPELLNKLHKELQDSEVPDKLNRLAKAFNTDTLVFTPKVRTTILEACADIAEMRHILMMSLGHRG